MPVSSTPVSIIQTAAPLGGRTVGLSISDNQDRTSRGFDRIHQNTYMYEVARALYRSGASISYGGHLGNEGFTANSLQHLIDEHQSSHQPQRIRSYVAWPLYRRPTALQEDFLKYADILELDPPGNFRGHKGEFLDPKPISNRYYWFCSLTEMRRKMNSEIQARVVMGGTLNGFTGRYPGIVEEALFAVAKSIPLYVCGGSGAPHGRLPS